MTYSDFDHLLDAEGKPVGPALTPERRTSVDTVIRWLAVTLRDQGFSANDVSSGRVDEVYDLQVAAARRIMKALGWHDDLEPEITNELFDLTCAVLEDGLKPGDAMYEATVGKTVDQVGGIPLSIAQIWRQKGVIVSTPEGDKEAIDLTGMRTNAMGEPMDDEGKRWVRYWDKASTQPADAAAIRSAHEPQAPKRRAPRVA
jgi:hypothetical protein